VFNPLAVDRIDEVPADRNIGRAALDRFIRELGHSLFGNGSSQVLGFAQGFCSFVASDYPLTLGAADVPAVVNEQVTEHQVLTSEAECPAGAC